MQNRSYKIPLIFAIILHLLLFIGLFFHFVPSMWQKAGPRSNVIEATVINPHALQDAKKPLSFKKPEPQPTKPQEKVQPIDKAKILAEQQKLMQAKQEAAEKAAQQKAKQVAQQKAQQAKLALQKAQQAEKVQQIKIKQQQAAATLAAKKLAAKKQQQKEAQQLQAAQQKMLQQQMAQEQKQLAAAASAAATNSENQKLQSEVDKYKALIVQTISHNWLVPDNVDKNISCQLFIRLGPGGVVLSVEVSQSSGNSALDSSAVSAVYKSSPLPVPADAALFDKFRELRLTVKPQKIIAGD